MDVPFMSWRLCSVHVGTGDRGRKKVVKFFWDIVIDLSKEFLKACPNATSGFSGKTPLQVRKAYLKSLPQRAKLVESQLIKDSHPSPFKPDKQTDPK